MKIKTIYTLFLFLFSFGTSYAQNNLGITWNSCYGGSENEMEPKVIETDFGYFLLSSTSSTSGEITFNHGSEDFWLVAIDSSGTILWDKCYGGSNAEIASCIISDSIGSYYIGGWVSSTDGDVKSQHYGGWDRWVVKINALGEIIWEKCYGGSGMDYGGLLKILNNGNILVYSATTSSDGDVPVNYGGLDVWLMVINPQGDILQNKVFGNFDQNNIFNIVQTRDNGFFFVSKANYAEGMVEGEPHGAEDVWAVKTDSLLNIEWQRLYGGSYTDYQSYGVLELEDGYVFLGNTVSCDGDVSGFHGVLGDITTDDIWVVKIDLTGNIIWQKCLGGSYSDYASDLLPTNSGGFVIFAKTNSSNGDVYGQHRVEWGFSDIWMIELNEDGEILSSQCYGGDRDERIFRGGVFQKSDNNYLISGLSDYNFGDVDCDIHGYLDYDLWVFEIKDCALYQPQTPMQPTGPDTLCYTLDSASVYTIGAASGAWGYTWQLEPEEAGTLTVDTLKAYIKWNQVYEGQANISVQSYNDCGESEWSPIKSTWVYNCVGLEEFNHSGLALKVYPNPAKDKVVFELNNFTPTSKADILIRDITGRIIAQIVIQQKRTSWSCEGLEAGVYFYSLQIGNGNISGKLLLQ
jgi:type IX secretion system substrate protein/PKD domain-containing protein